MELGVVCSGVVDGPGSVLNDVLNRLELVMA